MMWDYAEVTKEMGENGGPAKYIAKIRLHEHQKTVRTLNKNWLLATVPTLAVLIPLAVKGVYDLVEEHRHRNLVTDEEAQQAEQALIEELENTDTENPPC